MDVLEFLKNDYFAFAGLFVGILLIFEGVRQFFSRNTSDQAVRSRRMRMIQKGATTGELLDLLNPTHEGDLWSKVPFYSKLPVHLRQAGVEIKPIVFVLLCALAAVAITLGGYLFVGLLKSAALGIAIGMLVPVSILNNVVQKRMEKLDAQLPDALELMARGLKVGHPINTTIGSVAEDMPDPIATEFGIMVDQVSYGDDVVSAITDLANRIDTDDARYLAVSVGIQHGTGGNLARILQVLAGVMRSRAALRRKVHAVSSEGRMSARILSALPVLIFVMTMATSPAFYRDVMPDPMFLPMAIVIVFLVVANYFALQKLVNFDF